MAEAGETTDGIALRKSPADEAADRLATAKAAGDAEGVFKAVHALVSAQESEHQVLAAVAQVKGMLADVQASGNREAQAHVQVALAQLYVTKSEPAAALPAAEAAAELFRGLGLSKGLAEALEAGFNAHWALGSPMAGLQAANKELGSLRAAGDRKGEADVLEMLVQAHLQLGNPLSAAQAARSAVDIHRGRGDKENEGTMLQSIAMSEQLLGNVRDAFRSAKAALAAFKADKCAWGEEQARAMVSALLAELGQIEKAPDRQEALESLKHLAKAAEKKNSEEFQVAEFNLRKMRANRMVTDEDIVTNLGPFCQKDSSVIDFLDEQGFLNQKRGASGTMIKHLSKNGFYLQSVMGGMNFGPQFRPVYPHRVQQGPDRKDWWACEVGQLEETEAWQMELQYRPGIIDSAIQQLGALGFPDD